MAQNVTVEQVKDFITRIKDEYEIDSTWDAHHTQAYLMGLAGKVAKYINYWSKLKNLLLQVDNDYNKVYILRYSEYKDGNINYTQTEIKDLLPRDPELSELTNLKTIIIIALDTLEKQIDNLNKVRYDIKNYIEIEQFLAGK